MRMAREQSCTIVCAPMRDEQDRAATLLDLCDAGEAFSLKGLVAHGEGLVHDKNVGVDVDGSRKGKSHVHARRVGLHRLIDEDADVRKARDVVEPGVDVGAAHSEYGAVQVDVLAARELRVEASAKLQQSRDAAIDL